MKRSFIKAIIKTKKHKGQINIQTGKYIDMIKEGIIDPTKVTRTALENAVSVAGTMLITECTIVEDPKGIEKRIDDANQEIMQMR